MTTEAQLCGSGAARSAVRCLLLRGRPSAVVRLVVTVVVDAVERVAGRAFTHISEERLEAVPARADGDATSAPLRVACMVRITASVAHIRPRAIGGRLDSSGDVTVARSCADTTRSGCLAPEASARARLPIPQLHADHDAPSATVAAAEPRCSARATTGARPDEHHEATEALARYVDQAGGRNGH
jgi:hypothetical protein